MVLWTDRPAALRRLPAFGRSATVQAASSRSAGIRNPQTTIKLPDVIAEPGPIRLAPYMRQIADAIGDPAVERVTVLKSARVGFSTVLTAAVAVRLENLTKSILLRLLALRSCQSPG
jgi:hypothetical protein